MVLEIEAPASANELPDWALWTVSADGRWVAAAPYRGATGGWALDTSKRSFTALGDLQLVVAERVITLDPINRVYTDLESATQFQLPSGETVVPRYERVTATGGGVLARLSRDRDDEPARILVWHKQATPSWERTAAAGYLDVGIALSPDGARLGLVEKEPGERMAVTLLDAMTGQEVWKVHVDLESTIGSAQVGIPVMFGADGSTLFVAGNANLPAPGADYRWMELSTGNGAAEQMTAVDLLGATSDGVAATAGVANAHLWSAQIARFPESHRNPIVQWSCEYRRVVRGRTKQGFDPDGDSKRQRQVMGADGLGCPTRAIRGTISDGLTVVRVAGSRLRVLNWSTPP
jgi:hypothetical protein